MNKMREQPRTMILASASPRRQELLGVFGLPFTVCASHVDEQVDEWTSPAGYVMAIAQRKAGAIGVANDTPENALIIAADTTVVIDGDILGKPSDTAEAKAMLSRLQGRRHDVFTGLCVLDRQSGQIEVTHSQTAVHMKPLSARTIDAYVATGEPMDKAGSYGIQGRGATFIEAIDGDYFTVVGLPLSLLESVLTRMGIATWPPQM